ncbi:MAG TPA: tyrosine-type recombinase/integrase [Xanthobacteraceae bacterium]|nr:tyrosine-type recombinase/integrase [Xanthobacteraceae bacterium]
MGTRKQAPKNTYWRGSVLWGRIKVAGKEHKFSLRTSDAKIAERRAREERERLKSGIHFGEVRYLYDEAFPAWADHIQSQISLRTSKRYATSMGQIAGDLEAKFVDQIDKKLVQSIVDRRRRSGVTIATIKRDLTALSSFLDYCEDRGYREGNPALAVAKRLSERRDPIVLPELADIERVRRRAPGSLGAMIQAALKTGCRMDELVHAQRRNLDHARPQLTVVGKRNKRRTIELDFETWEMLKTLPASLGSPWLFWHGDGEPYRSMSSRFRYLVIWEHRAAQKAAQSKGLKKADFRPFTFHHLRHRHAVDWLKSGHSIYDLQKRLGHTSIKTTEMYLEFLTPDEVRAVTAGVPQKGEHTQRFDDTKIA